MKGEGRTGLATGRSDKSEPPQQGGVVCAPKVTEGAYVLKI